MIPCESDPDLHFDDNRAPEAARMCRACPAREACLALALDMESRQGPTGRYGVWGGLTPAERAAFAGVSAAVVEWCEQRPRTLATYACDRCGIRREWRPGRGRTCKDCLDVLKLDERRAS